MLRFIAVFFLLLISVPCYCQITTISISTNNNGQDVYINSADPNQNYSSSTQLSTYVDGTNTNPVYKRTLVEFDFSSIPSNAIIIDAELRFKKVSGYNNTLTEINAVETSWQENSVTFNSAPSALNTFPSMISQVPISSNITPCVSGCSSYTRHSFTVTDHVQHFINNPHLNYGWRLKSADETVSCVWRISPSGGYTLVCSKRGANYRASSTFNLIDNPPPQLVISYVLPIEISLSSVTHSTTLLDSDGSITASVTGGNGNYSYQWIDGATGNNISGATGLTLNNLSPGWYGLEVEDGEGNKEYMAFVIGAKCGKLEFDFQPDDRFVEDVTIRDDLPDSRLLNPYLYSQRVNFFGYYYLETLLKYKIILDSEVSLQNASVYLYGHSHNSSQGNETRVDEVTEKWYQDIVTWNTKPSTGSQITIIPSTSSSTEDVQIDVTSLFEDYISGTKQNNGMHFYLNYPPSQITRGMVFRSSRYSDFEYRPKLQLSVGSLCFENYHKPKRNLDAGYVFTQNGVLKFSLDEFYTQENLEEMEYTVYDMSRQDMNVTTFLPLNFDDNRYSLDLSSFNLTNNSFYVLEIRNSKNEKRFLKFQYKI